MNGARWKMISTLLPERAIYLRITVFCFSHLDSSTFVPSTPHSHRIYLGERERGGGGGGGWGLRANDEPTKWIRFFAFNARNRLGRQLLTRAYVRTGSGGKKERNRVNFFSSPWLFLLFLDSECTTRRRPHVGRYFIKSQSAANTGVGSSSVFMRPICRMIASIGDVLLRNNIFAANYGQFVTNKPDKLLPVYGIRYQKVRRKMPRTTIIV